MQQKKHNSEYKWPTKEELRKKLEHYWPGIPMPTGKADTGRITRYEPDMQFIKRPVSKVDVAVTATQAKHLQDAKKRMHAMNYTVIEDRTLAFMNNVQKIDEATAQYFRDKAARRLQEHMDKEFLNAATYNVAPKGDEPVALDWAKDMLAACSPPLKLAKWQEQMIRGFDRAEPGADKTVHAGEALYQKHWGVGKQVNFIVEKCAETNKLDVKIAVKGVGGHLVGTPEYERAVEAAKANDGFKDSPDIYGLNVAGMLCDLRERVWQNREHNKNNFDHRRKHLRGTPGMEAIGHDSGWAELVAACQNRPDVVIKVVTRHDGFLKYVELIQDSTIISAHAPLILHKAYLGDDRYAVFMERLWVPGDSNMTSAFKRGTTEYNFYHILHKMKSVDYHSGNWMRRTDGTPVIIDPWAGYW